MKYIILADSDNVEPFTIPRQLSEVHGETLIGRTIRLLKENGIEDIIVTSHDPRFDGLGATRYEPKHNDWRPRQETGYWLSGFPWELLNEPITFLFGDGYYSEEAIKKIIGTSTESVLFFCSYKNKGARYIKHHDEPLAFKVVDCALFKRHIERCKRLFDEGGRKGRNPIAWELYRSLNGIDIHKHELKGNVIIINDESCDVDRCEDVGLLNAI